MGMNTKRVRNVSKLSILCSFLAGMEFELKDSYLLGRNSTT
jgi:hypothetical protein